MPFASSRLPHILAVLVPALALGACGRTDGQAVAPLTTVYQVLAHHEQHPAETREVLLHGRLTYVDARWNLHVLQDDTGSLHVEPGERGLELFEGSNTTTEFLARHVFERMSAAARDGRLGPGSEGIAAIKVTLWESHIAWAAFEGTV